MRLNERAVRIACATAALIAALVLMLRYTGDPTQTAALLRDDGLACSRFAGQNQ